MSEHLSRPAEAPARPWREIITSFLKVGSTAYGGPAILGMMQAEFQEARQWVTKPRFLEGVALVNVLPGATMVQLGIFLGYVRAGWLGGLLAGLCFSIPGFIVMLALALAYATLGVHPMVRGALYGLGPVVLGVFIMAVYRLGTSALRARPHRLIALAAALAALASPLGTVAILLLAGAVGLLLFYSRRLGAVVLLALAVGIVGVALLPWTLAAMPGSPVETPRLGSLVALFSTIGAFTFGGGLSMIALMEEQVVRRLHWLSPEEFIAGLALGQLTPGPILMVAAYVGYKLHGALGALAGALAMFLPSFVLTLAVLPAYDRVRSLDWAKAVMQGVVPAVIGVMAIAILRMWRSAAPDPLANVVLVATVAALHLSRVTPMKAMLGGAAVGMLRSRLLALGAWARP
jgi:chromate transporter, chromate ion transporter (CHR) family